MMAIHQGEDAKVKSVLTDEQKAKYDAMQAKMREHREEHSGDQPAPPPPPPAL
jgi:Spy/CpxP family protein refolding chaperone